MKKNNKGFSYVEMILVLAIVAIMMGMITLSLGMVNRANINRGAEHLESYLERARTQSMARNQLRGTLTISCVDGAYYCYVGDPAYASSNSELLISAPSVQIGYYVNGGTSMEILDSGETLRIMYSSASGAFQPISTSGSTAEYCTSIVIMNGDKSRTIVLHTATGKCTLQ